MLYLCRYDREVGTLRQSINLSISQKLPSAYAERLATEYAAASDSYKKSFGQYFTPVEIGT